MSSLRPPWSPIDPEADSSARIDPQDTVNPVNTLSTSFRWDAIEMNESVQPDARDSLRGGCLCGAVRYRLDSAPFDAGWCHCRMCQLNSGSPAMAFAKVLSEDFVVERGSEHIRRYTSSEIAERWFCGQCGTPLLVRDFGGTTHDFSAATLDVPTAVTP